MANERVNKVVLGNEVLVDLTDSTVNPNVLLAGIKAYDASGQPITGQFTPSYHITLHQSQYDQLSQQEKMADENFFYIDDTTTISASIDDAHTSSGTVWSSSKVNLEIGGVATRVTTIEAILNKEKITTGVQCAVGDTSCVIQDSAIHTTSIIDPYFDNASETAPSNRHTTTIEGQVTVTFDALEEATTVLLRITNP